MKTINHEYYVSLEVAKLLKEAGFNWPCNHAICCDSTHYPNLKEGDVLEYNYLECSELMEGKKSHMLLCPTLDVAQRWLREVKNIAVYVCPSYEPAVFVATNVVADDEKWLMKWQVSATHYDIEADEIDLGDVEEKCFDTYEEALEASIKKILELILEKGE